jgi:hypothetical protein
MTVEEFARAYAYGLASNTKDDSRYDEYRRVLCEIREHGGGEERDRAFSFGMTNLGMIADARAANNVLGNFGLIGAVLAEIGHNVVDAREAELLGMTGEISPYDANWGGGDNDASDAGYGSEGGGPSGGSPHR